MHLSSRIETQAVVVQATLAARYDLLQKLLAVTRAQPLAPAPPPARSSAAATHPQVRLFPQDYTQAFTVNLHRKSRPRMLPIRIPFHAQHLQPVGVASPQPVEQR